MLESYVIDILKETLKTKFSSDQIKEHIDNLEDLFSGEAYEHFLNDDLSDPVQRYIIIKNIGTCLLIPTEIPDAVLAEMSSELKDRVSKYLDNLQSKVNKVITEAQQRINKSIRPKSPKKPEEMTREELLDYIESKWKKKD